MRAILLAISILTFGCTFTPNKQKLDIAVQGAVRQTGCSAKHLRITNAVLTVENVDCKGGCNNHHPSDDITFVATCGERSWACRQAGPSRYQEYQRQIREEYCAVPDDVFYPARKAVLEKFLARPLIYQTKHFQDRYEVSARRNLVKEISEINERLK
jgi:hypothetical protein